MADKANVSISEKGHAPDKPGTDVGGKGHCEHCDDHHRRLQAIEGRLGMAPQPGVAKEETGVDKEKAPSYERRRH